MEIFEAGPFLSGAAGASGDYYKEAAFSSKHCLQSSTPRLRSSQLYDLLRRGSIALPG
jgi:hypothetical protein